MADIYTRILLSVQSGSTLRIIQNVSSALGKNGLAGDLEKVAQAARTSGLDISKLETAEAHASEAAARLGVAEAKAAEALARVDTLAASGKASIEKLATANAHAALAAEKVKVAKDAASSSMQRATTEASRLTGQMDKATTSLRGAGTVASGVATAGITVFTVAMAGVGTAIATTIPKTLDFQESMNKTYGATDLTRSQIDAIGNSILDLGPKVRKGPQDLSDAFYYVAGAGYSGAQAMDILERSAKSASAGLTETTIPANAVTAILKAFPGICVAQAFDMLTVSVNTGKTELETFAPAIGQVSLSAQLAKASFGEASAALSALTNVMPSTSEAATVLKSLFESSSSTSNLAKQAAELHIAFDANAYSAMSFIDRLKYLQQITGGNSESLKQMLGTQEAMVAMQGLLSNGASDYSKALESVTNSAGAADEQFRKTGEGGKASWASTQARIEAIQIKIGTGLLPVIDSLVTAFNNVITVTSNVIKFFRDNEVAMVALQSVLIAVGAVILSIIIPAFIAWAIAMIPVVIGALTLAAPFILAAVIIAAIVFVIIMTIRRWGDIVKWLQGAWSAFTGWFAGILGTAQSIITSALTNTANFFTGIWNGIVAGVRAAWDFIVNAVKIGVMTMLAIIFFPIVAVAALFIWLYNHNYYFKALVDNIVSFFTGCFAWLQMAWTTAINWLIGVWGWLVGQATEKWGMLTGAIQAAIDFVRNILIIGWTIASTWLGDRWNELVGMARGAWEQVSAVFSGIWGAYIAPHLNSLWNFLSGWFSQLGQGALDAGKNFIKMLVDGITSGAGAVWNAVTGVASNIWKGLGFHSPAEAGPAADADKWMPNLVNMLSTDLVAGAPKMEQAANQLASPLVGIMGLPADIDRMTTLTLPPVSTGATSAAPAYAPRQPSGGNTIIYAPVFNINTMAQSQSEKRRLVDMINAEQAKDFHIESSGYASGGIY